MYYIFKNTKIYYEIHGNKKKSPLLILPGWGNTRCTFNNIISNFKDDFCIYIFDYPGFGNSDILKEIYSIYDYALLFNKFIKDMNINNPCVIAHSFGGRIISLLIGKHKLKINKLVLIDVAGIKRRKKISIFFKEKVYKLLKKISVFIPKDNRQNYLEYLLSIFASSDYLNININMRETFKNIVNEDLKKYYRNIDCSTLILWGENDKDTPLKDAYYISKYIEDSAVIVYKKAAHFSYLDYPNYTISILKKYLK